MSQSINRRDTSSLPPFEIKWAASIIKRLYHRLRVYIIFFHLIRRICSIVLLFCWAMRIMILIVLLMLLKSSWISYTCVIVINTRNWWIGSKIIAWWWFWLIPHQIPTTYHLLLSMRLSLSWFNFGKVKFKYSVISIESTAVIIQLLLL